MECDFEIVQENDQYFLVEYYIKESRWWGQKLVYKENKLFEYIRTWNASCYYNQNYQAKRWIPNIIENYKIKKHKI